MSKVYSEDKPVIDIIFDIYQRILYDKLESNDFNEHRILELIKYVSSNDINNLSSEKFTIFTQAICAKHYDVINYLLSMPEFDINTRILGGETALTCAINANDARIVKLLLEQDNIEVNFEDNDGITPLMQCNNIEILKLLINHNKTNINYQNYHGWTALMSHTLVNMTEFTKVLLTVPDIDINLQDNDGWTALMIVAKWGHIDIVKLLLSQQNIDIDITNNNYLTALGLAKICIDYEIAELLESFNKNAK